MQDTIGAALKPFDDRQRKVLENFLSGLIASLLCSLSLSFVCCRAIGRG
jgi:hypothetical protein